MLELIPASVFRDGTPRKLTGEQEELKRQIYEKMRPRRRKFGVVTPLGQSAISSTVSVTTTGIRSRSPTILWIFVWTSPNAPRSSWYANFCSTPRKRDSTATTMAAAPWNAPWASSTRMRNTSVFSISANGMPNFCARRGMPSAARRERRLPPTDAGRPARGDGCRGKRTFRRRRFSHRFSPIGGWSRPQRMLS